MKRSNNFWKKTAVTCGLLAIFLNMTGIESLHARECINLTLDSAVDIAMGKSYRIKQLELGIERTRHFLKARQASLKSHVSMRLNAPELNSLSERKWNSTLKKDEIIHEDTRRWQMDLSIRQPLILFGYPTNGYLSFNNKVYRYLQKDGESEVDYYNRYYLKFEQPLFRPNALKNNIENAELDLERSNLNYLVDRVRLLDRIADDYYDLFEVIYKNDVYSGQIENLEIISDITTAVVMQDSSRLIETMQIQVELANAREMLLKNQTEIRRETARIKQRLRLDHEDSVYIKPKIKVIPIEVDVDQAIQYGYSLRPHLRILSIDKRKNEINLNNSTGWDAFHLDLEMTYGLERQDDHFRSVWNEYDNSYSVSLSAYVPIWDWGRRKEHIQAYQISLEQTKLRIEESQNNIRTDIINAVDNLRESQQRAINMRSSMEIVQEVSNTGMRQYQEGNISLQDLLQMVSSQKETEINFLDAYLGYRKSLLSLMTHTYYDYENDRSLRKDFHTGS